MRVHPSCGATLRIENLRGIVPRNELRLKSSIALPAIELASYASRRSASNVRYGLIWPRAVFRRRMSAVCVFRPKLRLEGLGHFSTSNVSNGLGSDHLYNLIDH